MINLFNDEELEEALKYIMRDTTDILERMIKDAPLELQKNEVSIDLTKDTVKIVIERYQKALINITQKMKGAFKETNTAEMASKIEKQIKELQEIYDLELEGKQIEEFMEQIKFSREDADARTEEARNNIENEPEIDILEFFNSSSSKTNTYNAKEEQETINQRKKQEDELMSFMDETLHAFATLLEFKDIDENTHDSITHASRQSIEIYRTKYAQLLEQMGGFSVNPNVTLKESQINQMIKSLEAKYGGIKMEKEPEIDILEFFNSSSSKTNTYNDKEEQEAEDLWMGRFQLSDQTVDRKPNGVQDKSNFVEGLGQEMLKEENGQIQGKQSEEKGG